MVWKIENKSNVIIVTMNSNKTNCINYPFIKDANETLDIIEKDYPFKPLILTSHSDSNFSSGMDLKEVFKANTKEKLFALFQAFSDLITRIFTLRRRTIAAINGNAIAGGLFIALVCDYKISIQETNFKFGLTEINVGLTFPQSLALLKLRVTEKNCWNIALNGQLYSTLEAKDLGLIDEVVPKEKFMEKCIQEATRIRPEAMEAYSYVKLALLEGVLEQLVKEKDKRLEEFEIVKFSKGSQKIQMEILQKMTKSKL